MRRSRKGPDIAFGCVLPRPIHQPPEVRLATLAPAHPIHETPKGGLIGGCSDGGWDDVPVQGALSPAITRGFSC